MYIFHVYTKGVAGDNERVNDIVALAQGNNKVKCWLWECCRWFDGEIKRHQAGLVMVFTDGKSQIIPDQISLCDGTTFSRREEVESIASYCGLPQAD